MSDFRRVAWRDIVPRAFVCALSCVDCARAVVSIGGRGWSRRGVMHGIGRSCCGGD